MNPTMESPTYPGYDLTGFNFCLAEYVRYKPQEPSEWEDFLDDNGCLMRNEVVEAFASNVEQVLKKMNRQRTVRNQ